MLTVWVRRKLKRRETEACERERERERIIVSIVLMKDLEDLGGNGRSVKLNLDGLTRLTLRLNQLLFLQLIERLSPMIE